MIDDDFEDTWNDTTRRVSVRPDSWATDKIRAVIVQNDGPKGPQAFPISENITVIGRGSTCNIIIDSMELSRRHALITIDETDIKIEDLDSANGLFLNGVRIHSATLRDGDSFQLGSVIFSFREGAV